MRAVTDQPQLSRSREGPKTMTTKPQSGGPQNAAPDVAKLGYVRPPLVYLISLAAGALIQIATPLPFLLGTGRRIEDEILDADRGASDAQPHVSRLSTVISF